MEAWWYIGNETIDGNKFCIFLSNLIKEFRKINAFDIKMWF